MHSAAGKPGSAGQCPWPITRAGQGIGMAASKPLRITRRLMHGKGNGGRTKQQAGDTGWVHRHDVQHTLCP